MESFPVARRQLPGRTGFGLWEMPGNLNMPEEVRKNKIRPVIRIQDKAQNPRMYHRIFPVYRYLWDTFNEYYQETR